MKKASYGTGGWIKASNPFFNDIFIIIIIIVILSFFVLSPRSSLIMLHWCPTSTAGRATAYDS